MTAETTVRPAGVLIARLDRPAADPMPDFLLDPDGDPARWLPAPAAVVLPAAGEAWARAALRSQPVRVYLGEAALRDGDLVERLATEFGSDRVGVYAPARRMAVDWCLDTVSNADFRVVTPSLGEPRFEVLAADGGGTGTYLDWWLRVMFERGAGSALVQLDLVDDGDLNLAAGLVEEHGDRLWFSPRTPLTADFDAWTRWARIGRLAISADEAAGNPSVARLRDGRDLPVAA